jgi:transposase
MLKRWDRFVRFIDDDRICLKQQCENAIYADLRWDGSPGCSWVRIAAVTATLTMTDRLNDIDPLAWLADVLARIASFPQGRLHELLPWNWSAHARSIASPQAV